MKILYLNLSLLFLIHGTQSKFYFLNNDEKESSEYVYGLLGLNRIVSKYQYSLNTIGWKMAEMFLFKNCELRRSFGLANQERWSQNFCANQEIRKLRDLRIRRKKCIAMLISSSQKKQLLLFLQTYVVQISIQPFLSLAFVLLA